MKKFSITNLPLWIVAGLSLLINIVLVIALVSARNQLMAVKGAVGTALTDLASVLEDLKAGTFEYTVVIDEEMPIKGEVPVAFTVTVPIKTNVPVRTTVSGSVDVPLLGPISVSVPVSANAPVDLTLDVPINQSIPIDFNVPVNLTVPITIKVADTPLAKNITDLQAVLTALFNQLSGK